LHWFAWNSLPFLVTLPSAQSLFPAEIEAPNDDSLGFDLFGDDPESDLNGNTEPEIDEAAVTAILESVPQANREKVVDAIRRAGGDLGEALLSLTTS